MILAIVVSMVCVCFERSFTLMCAIYFICIYVLYI